MKRDGFKPPQTNELVNVFEDYMPIMFLNITIAEECPGEDLDNRRLAKRRDFRSWGCKTGDGGSLAWPCGKRSRVFLTGRLRLGTWKIMGWFVYFGAAELR
jgi:hypothetical protein